MAKKRGKVLKFVVGSALLGAPLAGCGGEPDMVNEPAPEPIAINEPPLEEPETTGMDEDGMEQAGMDETPDGVERVPRERRPTPNTPAPMRDDVLPPG